VRFGVREHGMAAICNGLALHGTGLIPYCATFFNFTDYMRGKADRDGAGSYVTVPHSSQTTAKVQETGTG